MVLIVQIHWEKQKLFKLGYAELKIDDLGRGIPEGDDDNGDDVNYESIFQYRKMNW